MILRAIAPKEYSDRWICPANPPYPYRAAVSPSIEISGSLPTTTSATARPEPQAMVQPSVPWPVFR